MRRRRLSRAASPERTIPSARSPSWTRATPWRARTRRCWRRLARTTCPRTRRSWSTRVGSASAPTRTRPCSGSPRKASPRLSPRTGSPVAPGTDRCTTSTSPPGRAIGTTRATASTEPRWRRRARSATPRARTPPVPRSSPRTPARTSPPARATVSAPPASATRATARRSPIAATGPPVEAASPEARGPRPRGHPPRGARHLRDPSADPSRASRVPLSPRWTKTP